MEPLDTLDALLERLKTADWKERESLKEQMLLVVQQIRRETAVERLESVRKSLPLEARWEVDEVLEALAPPPAPPAEEEAAAPEEEAPPSDGRIRMSDLKVVYEDPRGLVLYVDKKTGVRWFAQQPDPYTGQPSLMEVPPNQIEAVKTQLRGSPYWRLGSGVVG